MLIGQTIATNTTGGATYYTPWFPRQGNDCTSTFELIAIGPNGSIQVVMETKNSEETDASVSGTIGDGTLTTTDFNAGTKVRSFACANAKELCRYKVVFKLTSGTNTEACHFRILSPSWQTTGSQSI